jgi:hypothetical protein
VIYVHLGYNTAPNQKQFLDTALLTKKSSGNGTFVSDSASRISEAILCSENNDVDRISEEVLNSLDEQIKISVDTFYTGLLRRYLSHWNFKPY